MLSTCYYIEQINGEYKQFPIDYTKDLFLDEVISKITLTKTNEAQIITHRDQKLIYYVYIHKLRNGLIGGCIVLNNVMLSDITPVFECFEKLLYEWYSAGYLFFDSDRQLCKHAGDVEGMENDIASFMQEQETECIKLPSANYGGGDELLLFKFGDNTQRIQKGILTGEFCVIKKNDKPKWMVYAIEELEKQQIKSENIELEIKINEEQRRLEELKLQKKREELELLRKEREMLEMQKCNHLVEISEEEPPVNKRKKWGCFNTIVFVFLICWGPIGLVLAIVYLIYILIFHRFDIIV